MYAQKDVQSAACIGIAHAGSEALVVLAHMLNSRSDALGVAGQQSKSFTLDALRGGLGGRGQCTTGRGMRLRGRGAACVGRSGREWALGEEQAKMLALGEEQAVTIKKKMVYAPLVQLLRGKGYSVSLAADGGIHTMVFGASGTTTSHVRAAFAGQRYRLS